MSETPLINTAHTHSSLLASLLGPSLPSTSPYIIIADPPQVVTTCCLWCNLEKSVLGIYFRYQMLQNNPLLDLVTRTKNCSFLMFLHSGLDSAGRVFHSTWLWPGSGVGSQLKSGLAWAGRFKKPLQTGACTRLP